MARYPTSCCVLQARVIHPCSEPFDRLRAHSYLRPLQKPASDHPDVGQCKQRDELRGVFCKVPIASLDMAELALNHPQRVLDLGTHACIELPHLFVQLAPSRVPDGFALAWSHTG